MTTSIPQLPYAGILAELETFEGYLRSLALRRAPDRLRGVIAKLKEIEVARTQNRLPSLNKRADLTELVWSLVEGQEFADIFPGIRDYDPVVIKKLLQKALKGPFIQATKQAYPTLAETRSSNYAWARRFDKLAQTSPLADRLTS